MAILLYKFESLARLTGLAANSEHIGVSLLLVRRNLALAGYSFN